MTDFTVHTPETAPEDSKATLEAVAKAYGMIPNVIAIMAESPNTVAAYTTVSGLFAKGSFSDVEQHVVLQTINSANGCHYCTAAHATVAVGMRGVPAEIDTAIRENHPLSDGRLEALRLFTQTMVDKRGWLDGGELEAFLEAGYSKAQALEVVMAAGLKTMSNYINHFADTPVDAAFRAEAVKKAS